MNIVLVVGERPEQASALAERLGIVGVEAVPCAREWKLAVRCLTSHKISVVLTHVDGTAASRDFFALLRELTDVPIMALGNPAKAEPAIWYLDNGAIDYVSRKVPVDMLAAKLSALMRTNGNHHDPRVLEFGNLVVDVQAHSVSKNGVPVSLTPIEFKLLEELALNAGKACSRRLLLQKVWGNDFEDCAHYLRLYIGYLRQKIEDNPRRPRIIQTEWGYGYRLVATRGGRTEAAARPSLRVVSA